MCRKHKKQEKYTKLAYCAFGDIMRWALLNVFFSFCIYFILLWFVVCMCLMCISVCALVTCFAFLADKNKTKSNRNFALNHNAFSSTFYGSTAFPFSHEEPINLNRHLFKNAYDGNFWKEINEWNHVEIYWVTIE